MSAPIKILHLEDMASDAELVLRALKKGNLNFELKLVDNKVDFIKALTGFAPDIILSDHSLPSFNSHEALVIYNKANLHIPFILITATISEEFAVEVMKEGACDYILKDRMERLPNAVLGALEKYRLEAERKKYLDEVISNESLMKEAESLAGFGSWKIDLVQGNARWSDEAYRILNYKPGEVSPSIDNFLKKVHPDDLPVVRDSITKAMENSDSVEMDFRILHRPDAVKYCRFELVIERDSGHKALRVIGFIQDITEIRMAENEIKSLNESLEKKVEERTLQLREANKELEAFNYSISHDMRNPLQIINGFASILASKHKGNLNEDALGLLQKIKSHTKQMGQLIEDLLNFSRSGRQKLSKTELNMNEMVNAVVKDLENIYKNNDAEIIMHDLNHAYCDPSLIRQVWVNLISNALKYSSKKSHPAVEIGCSGVNGESVYYVKDNGAGFDMQYADKLFGAFKRLHEQSEFEGSGVGLAIVHRIITKHGGRIWADAKVGSGATFYFSLPQPEGN